MIGKALFPLGTSRLHWPLEYLRRANAADILFPGFGYFQSAGQIADIAEWLSGAPLAADPRWVFRKDSTPSNPFDLSSFDARRDFAEKRRDMFRSAGVILLEVASPVEFSLRGAAVQGNPNADRDVPFAEIWATGYYARHAPDLPVIRQEIERDALARNLGRIARAAGGRQVICTSHIFLSGGRDHGRAGFAGMLRDEACKLGWEFIDPTPFADRFGFRQGSDGQVDIHHLSWPGTAAFAAELLSSVARLTGQDVTESRLRRIRQDSWAGHIA